MLATTLTRGVAVAQDAERSSFNGRVGGLIPGSCSLHVNGETLNPRLLPVALPRVCECILMVFAPDE